MTHSSAAQRLAAVTSLAAILSAASLVGPRHAAGQTVRGVVMEERGQPVSGVVVSLLDDMTATAARALTDERGQFRLTARRPGTYRLATLRIGFRPAQSALFALGAGEEVSRQLVVGVIPVALSAVRVSGRSACNAPTDSATATFAAWEQARAALAATQLTAGARAIVATTVAYERTLDPSGRRVVSQSATARSDYVTQPWRSISPDSVRRVGFIVTDRDGSITYYAPGLQVLLSDMFLEDHCFRLARSRDASRLGIAFKPTRARRNDRGVARIRGTLWLDRSSSELRSLQFRYVNASSAQEEHAGGDMEFTRMRNGSWVISRWGIRMPGLEYRARSQTFGGSDTTVTEIRVAGGELALALRGSDTLWARPLLTIAGTVIDSASGTPAAGSRVTVAGTQLVARADARGRFSLQGALPGQYTLEVRTRSLDSAGVSYPIPLTLTDSASGVVELRVPSASQIVTALCGGRRLDVPGIVIGTVTVRGDSVPPRNVTVIAEWREQRLRQGAAPGGPLTEDRAHWLDARSDARGGFRLCGVPPGTVLTLRAEHDSAAAVAPATVRIDPASRFARAELVLDRAATRGATLTGLVVDSAQRPIADAEVALPDVPKGVHSNDRGAFRVGDIPPGTHRVTVRRLGYGPLDTTIVFRANQTVDRRVHLTRVVALDSVSVIAQHYVIPSFDEHRKMGLGQFITREQLAKQGGRKLADILRELPTVNVIQGTAGRSWLTSKRIGVAQRDGIVTALHWADSLAGAPAGRCYVRVYLDNTLVYRGRRHEQLFDVNSIAPEQIEAVEFYATQIQAPARYGGPDAVCGVLVIWTRRSG